MGTGEFGDPITVGEPARSGQVLHRIGRLIHQRLRLGAERLFGHGWFSEQLRETA